MMDLIKKYKPHTPPRKGFLNVLLLGTTSFLNDLSSEMIIPILPLFITALGSGGISIGLIGGIRESITSLVKIGGGILSDKLGRRKGFVVAGYLVSAFFKLCLGLAGDWQQVMIFTGLERVGKGLRTAPRDAIIADSLSTERGKGFGIHRTMDTAGALVGSILAFLLIWRFGISFRTIILIAGLIAFVSLLPLVFVREKKKSPQKVQLYVSIKALPVKLKKFLFVSSIFMLGNFSYMFFILKARDTLSPLIPLRLERLSLGVPVLLYVLFSLFYALFSTPMGIIADRVGKGKVILSGYLLFAFVLLGFAIFSSIIPIVILFALYGIVHAILDTNQRALVADLALESQKATALGTFHMVVGLCSLPGSIVAGVLWQVSPVLPFLFGIITSFVAFVAFLKFAG